LFPTLGWLPIRLILKNRPQDPTPRPGFTDLATDPSIPAFSVPGSLLEKSNADRSAPQRSLEDVPAELDSGENHAYHQTRPGIDTAHLSVARL
jgi:hypothetical protein